MWDPWDHLEGATVVYGRCAIPGLYWPARQAILLQEGLSAALARSVLAEELGHHTLGHSPNVNQAETARMELRARRWAAVRLVTIEDLGQAMRNSDRLEDMAHELDVDPELLEVRIRWLTDTERRELGCETCPSVERSQDGW